MAALDVMGKALPLLNIEYCLQAAQPLVQAGLDLLGIDLRLGPPVGRNCRQHTFHLPRCLSNLLHRTPEGHRPTAVERRPLSERPYFVWPMFACWLRAPRRGVHGFGP